MPPAPRLILASTSIYRRELLTRLGLPFEVIGPAVDEAPTPGERPASTALRLARAKADAVAAAHPDALVIGSDQVADLEGVALGKPGDHAGATAQLKRMRGRQVVFHTAVAVVRRDRRHAATELVPSTVRFRDLSDAEIAGYLAREQPYDCAGSAKAEGLGIALLESIESPDPTALIGLPLIRTFEMLRAAGLDPGGAAMTGQTGTLYLVPNALDFGIEASSAIAIDELVPRSALRAAARLEHWLAENAKTARAYLRRVDAVVALKKPLQAIEIVELPRPPKGRPTADDPTAIDALLAPALAGHDLGLMSEAGLAAVADPGAAVVAAAHRLNVAVRALPGASAITLALAASGLNGQSFAFTGYVPVPSGERTRRIGQLEQRSRSLAQTQLVIETPYRNQALLDALVASLDESTRLAVSVGLTTAAEWTRSDRVAAWRRTTSELSPDLPAVFAFLAG